MKSKFSNTLNENLNQTNKKTNKNISKLHLKKIFYLFIFRGRGRDGEREGKKHQCVVDSRAPGSGGLT